MNKTYRQGQILRLIKNRKIHTQDQLAQELAAQGITATQVTLSRDIRELGLVKTPEGYRQVEATTGPGIEYMAGGVPLACSLRAESPRAEDGSGAREFGCGVARSGRMAGGGRHHRGRRHRPGCYAGCRHSARCCRSG